MTTIAIEEHWTTPKLTAALKGLPEESRDHSLAFNEMGDNLARLEDIGEARIAAMDEQGIDMQIISVAPPATGPLAPADAVSLSREMNDLAVEAGIVWLRMAGTGISRAPERYWPVIDLGFAAISAGVPCAMISPPCTPAPGPRSTT